MSVFASGKRAPALCDRCGWTYPLNSLRPEWNGLKVCPECWEPKHPQLEPRSVIDATALREPRPDNQVQVVTAKVHGLTLHVRVLHAIDPIKTIKPEPSGVSATSAIGTAVPSISAAPSGVSATGGVPTQNTPFWPAGVSSTSAIGTVVGTVQVAVDGNGAESIIGTGIIGEENISISIPVTGVSSTGAIGNPVPNPGYGVGSWGEGRWGE